MHVKHKRMYQDDLLTCIILMCWFSVTILERCYSPIITSMLLIHVQLYCPVLCFKFYDVILLDVHNVLAETVWLTVSNVDIVH